MIEAFSPQEKKNMAQIINMENAGDIFPCDVCGKTDIGHAMEEAFIPAWAWKGRPAGYDDPEIDHSGFELCGHLMTQNKFCDGVKFGRNHTPIEVI